MPVKRPEPSLMLELIKWTTLCSKSSWWTTCWQQTQHNKQTNKQKTLLALLHLYKTPKNYSKFCRWAAFMNTNSWLFTGTKKKIQLNWKMLPWFHLIGINYKLELQTHLVFVFLCTTRYSRYVFGLSYEVLFKYHKQCHRTGLSNKALGTGSLNVELQLSPFVIHLVFLQERINHLSKKMPPEIKSFPWLFARTGLWNSIYLQATINKRTISLTLYLISIPFLTSWKHAITCSTDISAKTVVKVYNCNFVCRLF